MAGRFSDFRNTGFLTSHFTDEVTRAANAIVALTRTPEFAQQAAAAVPKGLEVPNESAHPNFLVVDFAICEEGRHLVPRLIELQAFPSLFGFQFLLLGCIRKAYPVMPRNWTSSFGGIKDDAYLDLLRRTIIADSAPESVVLLEIEPEKRKDANRFRRNGNTSWHSPGLRDENQEARPPVIL